MSKSLIPNMISYTMAFLIGMHANNIWTLYITLILYVVFDLTVIKFINKKFNVNPITTTQK